MLFLVLTLAVTSIFIARHNMQNTYSIPSASMEPTLKTGQQISIDPNAYTQEAIRVGDVIVFDGQGSFAPYRSTTKIERITNEILEFLGFIPEQDAVVKRVLGTAGDEVSCCTNNQLVINGKPVKEPYLAEVNKPASEQQFTVHVPEGKVFVLGDNRNNSFDSRHLLGRPGGGMIPTERVYGRLIETSNIE